MERAILFIDGFNVYHSLVKDPALQKYRWLDYSRLGENLLRQGETLEDVFYFTAFRHEPGQRKRHQLFNEVQKELGVKVILGQFKRRDRFCEKCGLNTESYEEKQTDVGIAIEMLCQAMHNHYDIALVLSADTDLVPAIQAVKKEFRDKRVHVFFPAGNPGTSELKNAADLCATLDVGILRDSQLPPTLTVGGKTLSKPEEW